MTILVTGGAGFIGSHFIEWLLANSDERVVCLDNYNDFYDPARKRQNVRRFAQDARVAMVEASFCDPLAVRRTLGEHGVRQVVHLGAYAGVRPSVERPLVYEETNVRGTLVLLEAAREFGLERFVLASSSTVYGRGARPPFVEDGPLGVPLSPYGVSKRAAELFALAYHDLHSLPVVILRPFSVYGSRIRPDLAMHLFAEAIVAGRPLRLLGDGSARRDFTHVSDVCRGIAAAMTAPAAIGEALNLGHDEPVSIRQLIELFGRQFGREPIIESAPAAAADMPITHANLGKSRRILGYEPQVALADGVREFADWFRRQ